MDALINRKTISTKKALEILTISKGQLYKLLRAKVISAIDVSGPDARRKRYRFFEDELSELLTKRMIFERRRVIIDGEYPIEAKGK